MKAIYLTNRFFWAFGGLVLLFVVSFWVPVLLPASQAIFVLLLAVVILDGLLLFGRQLEVSATRHTPKMMGLGDENPIKITLNSKANLPLRLRVIDELPVQFQRRDFEYRVGLQPGAAEKLQYTLRPVERGRYAFGDINLFLSSPIGLLERRWIAPAEVTIPVYPSVLQMKQLELRALDRIAQHPGIKKIRRIGHSYEFEQIKNYVRGDDYRSINWKASSRRSTLMVNQYEDERSQQIYSIIDKSRVMKMPFKGLSLMDYAVNASLAISNIALKKYDRAGLITFSDKIGATVKADSKAMQLNKILNALYAEEERQVEANYELLYYAARKLIAGRSMILLYTNFESRFALERALPFLRRINRTHLLVVIFFENTEIRTFIEKEAEHIEDIYLQTVARKYLNEKAQMVHQLRQYGIQAVLTRPEDLSVNTVNKYLELKSRGLI
ncbi:MAG: DUF58 domain-containing protein [Phaeodactylibacter sp.]|uniref:DUF58 domain-containing protein n=1 Tax=Phaeodactylibacter sp. TaxID=1940289 RepID=UPI0032ED9E85